MADWWDNVDLFFEFAPTNSPLTAVSACTWVDISSRVRSFSCRRGRSNELSTTSPGTATIVLDNRDSQLDPAYTSGTWFGELLPMRRFRVRATVGVTTATLFTGYVLGYPQSYPGLLDSVVVVQCVDGFRALEQSRCDANAYETEVLADSPSAYWRLESIDDQLTSAAVVGGLDLINHTSSADLAQSITVSRPVGATSGITMYSGTAIDVPTAAPHAIGGWFTGFNATNTGGSIGLRASTGATNHIGVSVTGSDRTLSVRYSNVTDNRTLAIVDTGVTLPAEGTHVFVAADTTNIKLYVNGIERWTSALSVGTTSVSFSFTGTLIDTESDDASDRAITGPAVFTTAPSAARILEQATAGMTGYGHPMGERGGARIGRILDSIGWPSADRDLSTGETVLDSWLPAEGTALSGCREVEATEQGLFFMSGDGKATFRDRQWFMTNTRAITVQATLGDDPGEIRYNDIDVDSNEATYIRNRVTCSYSSGSVTVKDATSIAAYTEQADSVTASNLSSGWLARQLAAFRLRLRKDPATRIPRATINVRGGNGAAVNLAALIDLDLGDRVKAIRRPRDTVDPIETVAQLAGIEHKIERGGMWTIDTYLAPTVPSYTEGPYLTVGDATYGLIGVAAGNLVPY
jgi:hypothetical protein